MESWDSNSSGGSSESRRDTSEAHGNLDRPPSLQSESGQQGKVKDLVSNSACASPPCLDPQGEDGSQSDNSENSQCTGSDKSSNQSKVKSINDKDSSNSTPWKLVNGSNEDSSESSPDIVPMNCDSPDLSKKTDAKESVPVKNGTRESIPSTETNYDNSVSVKPELSISAIPSEDEKDMDISGEDVKKEQHQEDNVEMEIEVSDNEAETPVKSEGKATPTDSESAPVETRRRSLRNAARRASETTPAPETPVKTPTTSHRGRSRSPRGSPNKAELKLLKESKNDNKSNHQSSPLELTVTPKPPVVVEPPVEKFDGMDEGILKEAKFPDFLKGTFELGSYVPLKDLNSSQLKLKDGESLLDTPSLLVPLLVKKPNRVDKTSLGDAAKDDTTVKRNTWETKAYFTSSIGEFLIGIGLSRVTEWYEKDVVKSKHRQQKREGQSEELDEELQRHKKNWGQARVANEPFNFDMKRCSHCDFKTESKLVLDGHYLIPHLTSRREYRCNFCPFITRDPKAILFHMEALHGKKGRLDPSSQCFYDCPFCTFETNLKTKATSHINKCQKYFLPSRNQYPPSDWEYPAVTVKPITMGDIKSYEMCIAAASAVARSNPSLAPGLKVGRPVGRPPGIGGSPKMIRPASPYRTLPNPQSSVSLYQQIVTTSSYKDGRLPQLSSALLQKSRFPALGKLQSKPEITVAVPGGQIYQVVNNNGQVVPVLSGSGSQFLLPTGNNSGQAQPVALFSNLAGSSKNSISLIPQGSNTIKRGMTTISNIRGAPASASSLPPKLQGPYGPPNQATKAPNSTHPLLGNTTFVICEICDGYLKDLEQLRTHMLWIHKVKIHPKMLASRPPLNCQKCQWRFFTDQGLERHLLGAHGLVTSNMQELANKGQDGGRCTVCGRVYVCKLVSHMNQVHKVTLKPAHLSYKCTVCSATFNLYKLFENHVYMFHSGSVKRTSSGTDESTAAKKKAPTPSSIQAPVVEKKVIEIASPKVVSQPATVEKPKEPETTATTLIKVNTEKNEENEVDRAASEEKESEQDEIPKETAPKGAIKKNSDFAAKGVVECDWCGARVRKLHMHMRVRHTRKCRVRLCRIEKCEKCLCSFDGMVVLHTADFEDSDNDAVAAGTTVTMEKVLPIAD